ncbi:MAG: phosphoribosylaminoimidazolesuccinocarboxamide synthase [Elusimicrobia bacterium]|nr:phosphoribosylaminoimidazolesuccinocarboxamide synthase [Elusimicrobiota bacterium]
MEGILVRSEIPGLPLVRRGKVRDVYALGEDRLLIVATDRLSAFDHVLPTPIPEKGRILTQVSAFWFKKTKSLAPNHFLSADLKEIQGELPSGITLSPALYEGKVTLAKRAERIDAECVVRGYLAGSGFKEYKKTGMVCGHKLPIGLSEASQLPQPIFTPATKADEGHDENISREELSRMVGQETAKELETLSLNIYDYAAALLKERGLILADTKFEFGRSEGRLIVIDEMLTPDSSRIWPAASYKPGSSPASFDKQHVRDHLEKIGWDKTPPIPSLPSEIVEGTAGRYREFLRILQS